MTHALVCPACGAEQPPDVQPGPCIACVRAGRISLEGQAVRSPLSPEETCDVQAPRAALPMSATEHVAFPDERYPDAARLTDVRPRIAGYEVIGPPRFGGMGVVWPAQQLGTRRPVALKLLGARQLTTSGRARFVREVELAARLQHPHIARVYDSGVHEGNYFYAMELVDGLPLDEYVAHQHLGQTQILELMALVCRAVHHAHVRGVIHCDLKPSNILVTPDGQPHVLDFGLARLVTGSPDGLAESGAAPGTPAYMSPEQAAGSLDHIDTRSDVYSLGNIAYRLLTGRPPHSMDGPLTEVLRRIATVPVAPASLARPGMNRELEALLSKALHADPERRYASAGEMARDIHNFVTGEPLAAVGSSTAYLLRKRLVKHRLKVSAAALVLLSVALMAIFSYVRISREAKKARIVKETFQHMLGAIDPRNSGGRDVTAELLRRANEGLSSHFASEPRIEADIRDTLGVSLLSLGQFPAAEAQFERAVELRRRAFGPSDRRTLAATVNLAKAYRERGRLKESAELCRRTIAACEAALGADDRETLRARIALAYVLNDSDQNAEALGPIREAWRHARRHLGEADDDTIACAIVLALVLRDIGGEANLDEAEALCRSTLRVRTDKHGLRHPDTLEATHDLASVLTVKGLYEDAERLYRSAIDAGLEVLNRPAVAGEPARHTHPDLLIWRSDHAFALRALNRRDEAEEIYSEILPACIAGRGPSHPYTIILQSNYAAVLVDQKKWAEAEYHCRQVNELQKDQWGADNPQTLAFRDMLAQILGARNQWEDSLRIYEETLEVRRKRLPPGDPELVAAERNVAIATAYHKRWLQARDAGGGTGVEPAGGQR